MHSPSFHAGCKVDMGAVGGPAFVGAHPGFRAVARIGGMANGGVAITLDRPIDAASSMVMCNGRGGYAPGSAQWPTGEVAEGDDVVNVYNLNEGTAVGGAPADSSYADTTVQVLVVRLAWDSVDVPPVA